ncbi:pyridoxamine 5'-phosphate oxidase family protein [Streptosporangium sp. NPDC023615]|uniref:pyridoxamine 5'-phosphate oxidase family protein n=1 Tax=Streptosporangium sp. NPDC023615 TaxID=3154794 RepID=UPI0034441BC4
MSDITPAPDGLGRRVALNRERLGLTREELAERSGIPPTSVEYIEENPVGVTDGALSHLADALDTTRGDLLAGDLERPLDHEPPPPKDLAPEECMRLIAPGGVGRVAFDGPAGPAVLPVNYRVHDGVIVFRTRSGGPMDQDLRTGTEGVEMKIGFEVDRIDETRREGWSVLVQGPVHHVSPEELPSVAGLGVEPWAGGERDLYVRIAPSRITGRRILAS